MFRVCIFLFIFASACALSSCGQKGSLYLPDEAEKSEQ
ncbi:MAG: lipoprotein [Pseudomonadota bacterium]